MSDLGVILIFSEGTIETAFATERRKMERARSGHTLMSIVDFDDVKSFADSFTTFFAGDEVHSEERNGVLKRQVKTRLLKMSRNLQRAFGRRAQESDVLEVSLEATISETGPEPNPQMRRRLKSRNTSRGPWPSRRWRTSC